MTLIALTPGEPAGIGPDLVIQLAAAGALTDVVVIADPELMAQRAEQLGVALDIATYRVGDVPEAGALAVLPVELAAPVTAGTLDKRNAQYVLATIEQAVTGCLDGSFDALVTGPVHKGVINDAGIPFTGHTEYLAALCGKGHPVMMLVADALRVALVTTHLPLRDVADAITVERLITVLTVLHHDLQTRFQLDDPRILVCGLNPHAGEGGHLGREEIETIEPVLESLRQQEGMRLRGPLPADTAFTPRLLERADAVLAMYHDQGLPVLKYAGFGRAVNVTLGLPIIRTSVDHGTALELAASGKAETGSFLAAIEAARSMAAA